MSDPQPQPQQQRDTGRPRPDLAAPTTGVTTGQEPAQPSPWLVRPSTAEPQPALLVEVHPQPTATTTATATAAVGATSSHKEEEEDNKEASPSAGAPARKKPKPMLASSGPDDQFLDQQEQERLRQVCKDIGFPDEVHDAAVRFLTQLRLTRSPPWVPGGYDAWMAAALFLLDQDITPARVVRSRNLISLTTILHKCNVPFVEYNTALNSVVDACVSSPRLPPVHPALGRRIVAIKWTFTVLAPIWERTTQIYQRYLTRKFQTADTKSSALQYVWTSFIIAKRISLSQSAQRQMMLLLALVVCALRHLLRVCAPLDRFVAAPHARALRADTSVWGEESLRHIAQDLDLDCDLLQVVHRTYWRHFLEKFGDKITFLPTLGLPTHQTLTALDQAYATLLSSPMHCTIDERLFAARDVVVMAGPPPPSPAAFSIPKSFVDATQSPVVRLSEPLSSPHHRRHHQLSSPSPSCSGGADERSLEEMLEAEGATRPPVELAAMLIQSDLLATVDTAVQQAKTEFMDRCTRQFPTVDAREFENHWSTAVSVFHCVISAIMNTEPDATREVLLRALCRDDNMCAMLAFSSQIASIVTHFTPTMSPSGDITWVLDVFNAKPVTYWKVTERAMATLLCRYPQVAAPLARCERHILSCLMWRRSWAHPPLLAGLPAVEEANNPWRRGSTHARTGRDGDGGDDEENDGGDGEKGARRKTKKQQKKKQKKQQSTSSSAHAHGPPTAEERTRTTTLLLANKFYDAMLKRLAMICRLADDIDAVLKRKIWTTFEFAAMKHPDLFVDRHADQILLCCIFVTMKLLKPGAASFTKLLLLYESVVKDAAYVDEVLHRIPVRNDERLHTSDGGSDGDGGRGGADDAPARGQAGVSADADDSEVKKVQIFTFYNDVFLPRMQSFALRWTSEGGEDEPITASYPRSGNTIAATPHIPTRHGAVRLRHLPHFSPAPRHQVSQPVAGPFHATSTPMAGAARASSLRVSA
ncbi:hypothetical protein PTSG_09993 [Salpingoeca rosetta]|uniref:Retinoblastoma-associated protein A-box domain-containing protein n=1 Tax=Salpingoeca rosetta (strain ATCC 50818 / BSB-021) TaxID=946362 RepID=F2UP70_SALR5|nr:uncharacterized protein PTSG_09993 [Salpingoeca rosetta]EGD79425.1 hypothetical protein PTSG_09993 [Salpingoeca rosetta]|eukprot:XP_004988906.1 hypothetical protein PTSG_09993 [Salpingoeca rosetta]